MSGAEALRRNWRLYLYEAAELALFMISACAFTVLLFAPDAPAQQLIPSALVRRLLMGLAMGATAIGIIHSPMGKRSGAHFNPAITLTYLRLGKIAVWDAAFYVLFQFLGGMAGVGLATLCLAKKLAQPGVAFAVTVPGPSGPGAAFAAECFMALLLMGVVLWLSNRPAYARFTSYAVGALITFYIVLFAPVSGFSINPARTTGSAVFADVWTAVWMYFTAPILGMLVAAEMFRRTQGEDRILCAKLHPDPRFLCPFLCNFPGHRHAPDAPRNARPTASALP